MGNRSGTLLEKNIERIFKLAGFRTKRNVIIKDYEIDVLAEYQNLTIIVQCKQYEKSYINVKDIIHQWESKNKKIGANKVIVAIFGQEATENERNLAKKFNVVLWDGRDVEQYQDIAIEQGKSARDYILKGLDLISLTKGMKQEFVEPFISIEELKRELNKKLKIKNWKFNTTYSPILITKMLVTYKEDDFSFKNNYVFYVNIRDKNIKLIDEVTVNNDKVTSTKPREAKYEKIIVDMVDVDEFLIKKSIEKSKSIYYFSNLKSQFAELEGLYSKSKDDIFDSVKNSYLNEIEGKIDDIRYRYTPRIEDIEENIEDINLEIEQLEKERNELRGFLGYRGETDSEKRRNKEKYHNLGKRQERKELKIDQLESKKNLITKRMNEEIERINQRYDTIIKNSIEKFDFVPEEHDCKIQEKKILWLSKVQGEVITASNKFSVAFDYKKIAKIGECNQCKSNFIDVREIKVCSICGNTFCSKHILKCERCGKETCKKDSWTCDICKKNYCNNEKKIKCSHCGNKFCEDCINKCSICNKNFCKEHLYKCNVCKKLVCKEDSKKCPVCKKVVCNKYLVKCKGCGKSVCKDDFIKCPNCSKTICKDCIRIKRKFLIIKKQRCVFCIDEK